MFPASLSPEAPILSRSVPASIVLDDLAAGRDGALYVTDTGFTPGAGGALGPSGSDALYRFDAAGRPVAAAHGGGSGRR